MAALSAAPMSPPLLLAATAALLGAAACLLHQRRQRSRLCWTAVGTVSAINLYPLKSGAGVQCQEARITKLGLRRAAVLDRCLAVVCDGKVLSASAHSHLVLIAVDVSDVDVTLTASGMTPLTVPLPRDGEDASLVHVDLYDHPETGVDLGPAAARWLADFFADGKTYTLIYFLPGSVEPRRMVNLPQPWAHLGTPDDVMTYNFTTTMSAVCSSSLDELNRRLATPVTIDHFRINLVVSGAPAFDDDTWRRVRVGGAVLRRTRPLHRCVITLVDPRSGHIRADMEPLRTLRTFRLAKGAEERRLYKESPLLGSALAVDEEGDVAVGDTVYVMRK